MTTYIYFQFLVGMTTSPSESTLNFERLLVKQKINHPEYGKALHNFIKTWR